MISSARRLRFRADLWLWARLLPLLAYRRDLSSLLALSEPASARPYAGLEAAEVARHAKRTARRPWFMRDRRCLREGILAHRFLRLAGYEPELRFGIDRTSVSGDLLGAH